MSIRALQEQIGAIEKVLIKHYVKRKWLRSSVIQTHEHARCLEYRSGPMLVVTGYERGGAQTRFGLFAELDVLNASLAPLVKRKRELEKDIEAIADAAKEAA
jgi:hypothetical protein